MEQDIIIKFCIVGEPAVGKTSMLYQYIHNKFDEKVRPTIGCDFSTKLKSTIDGRPVRLQLWDIAGQERFNAVSKMYLRGALGCAIVCSANEKNTLEETLKWKKIIEENSEFGGGLEIPCMLVQNKSDLIFPDSMEEHQTPPFLHNFAKTHGFCGCYQTSAKDNKNIHEVFQELLDQTMKRGLVKTSKTGGTAPSSVEAAGDKQPVIKLTAVKNSEGDKDKKNKKVCC